MRAQIFLVPSLAFTVMDPSEPKTQVALHSGLLQGMIINCDNDADLLANLKFCADFGHYAEVTMLKDDEPWPTVETRRESFFNG